MTDQPNTPPAEDTEGHYHLYSDQGLKDDITEVPEDDTHGTEVSEHGEDSEGHLMVAHSDRNLKESIDEVPDEEDTEGHG